MRLVAYQEALVEEGLHILSELKLVYLAMQMRTGKTPVSLTIGKEAGYKRAIFVTTKKAMPGIQDVARQLGLSNWVDVINYESLHKYYGSHNTYDLVILDEAHRMGAYPMPGTTWKTVKAFTRGKPIIYNSGTPTPESWSQIYNQLALSDHSPFKQYVNFYKWANEYVDVGVKYIRSMPIKTYNNAKIDEISEVIGPYMVYFTQEQAGFTNYKVNEVEHYVDLPDSLAVHIAALRSNRIVRLNSKTILADTGAKMQSKEHQLWSGTILDNDSIPIVIDDYKLQYIKKTFKPPFAIYYKYQAEKEMIERTFGSQLENDWTKLDDRKIFYSQLQSGREGLDLSKLDDLIVLNPDFSYLNYDQVRYRMSHMNKSKLSTMHFILSRHQMLGKGIDQAVLAIVRAKETFTQAHYQSFKDS